MPDEITWEAPEFEYTPKGPDWYWTVGIIGVTLIIISILSGNLLFAIVLAFAAVTIGIQGGQKPELIEFGVTRRGVRIDNTLYPFSSLASFWVENNPYEQKLILKSEKNLMPHIIIPIEDIDPEELRHFIIQFLPEEELQEPISHKIMEYLGF